MLKTINNSFLKSFKTEKNHQTSILNFIFAKRTKFSDAFFRLPEFEHKKLVLLRHEFAQEAKINDLKESVKSSLATNTKLNRSDVENLFYTSKSKEDLEFALTAFKS
jgi:patatin-like phospholipase/acyl hydrolase